MVLLLKLVDVILLSVHVVIALLLTPSLPSNRRSSRSTSRRKNYYNNNNKSSTHRSLSRGRKSDVICEEDEGELENERINSSANMSSKRRDRDREHRDRDREASRGKSRDRDRSDKNRDHGRERDRERDNKYHHDRVRDRDRSPEATGSKKSSTAHLREWDRGKVMFDDRDRSIDSTSGSPANNRFMHDSPNSSQKIILSSRSAKENWRNKDNSQRDREGRRDRDPSYDRERTLRSDYQDYSYHDDRKTDTRDRRNRRYDGHDRREPDDRDRDRDRQVRIQKTDERSKKSSSSLRKDIHYSSAENININNLPKKNQRDQGAQSNQYSSKKKSNGYNFKRNDRENWRDDHDQENTITNNDRLSSNLRLSKSHNHISSSPSLDSSSSVSYHAKSQNNTLRSKDRDRERDRDRELNRNRDREERRDRDTEADKRRRDCRDRDDRRERSKSRDRERRERSKSRDRTWEERKYDQNYDHEETTRKEERTHTHNNKNELASPPPPRGTTSGQNYQSSAAANIIRKIKQYKASAGPNLQHSSNFDDTPYTSTPSKSPRNPNNCNAANSSIAMSSTSNQNRQNHLSGTSSNFSNQLSATNINNKSRHSSAHSGNGKTSNLTNADQIPINIEGLTISEGIEEPTITTTLTKDNTEGLSVNITSANIVSLNNNDGISKFPLDVDMIEGQDTLNVDKDKSITDSGVIVGGSTTVPTTACNSTGTNYDNTSKPNNTEVAFKQVKNKDLCIYVHSSGTLTKRNDMKSPGESSGMIVQDSCHFLPLIAQQALQTPMAEETSFYTPTGTKDVEHTVQNIISIPGLYARKEYRNIIEIYDIPVGFGWGKRFLKYFSHFLWMNNINFLCTWVYVKIVLQV